MSINNLFWQFQKINYILPDLSSQSSNSSQYSDSNQGEASNSSELIYALETEIANLQKTQDLLFFGKFLLTCATVIAPLIMGLIYYFNPNSVITIPIISGVTSGFLGSLVLLCGYEKYNSNKIAKKIQQKSILGQNIFDPERGLFQEGDRSASYLVDNDSEDLQISTSRFSFDQREHSSAGNSDVDDHQDEKTSEENPSSEFYYTSNPARIEDTSDSGVEEMSTSPRDNQSNAPRGEAPRAVITNRTGLGPNAVDINSSLTSDSYKAQY